MIPLHLFEDVCTYVQVRIDKTALGKNYKARGQKNYNSFIEYIEKYVNRKAIDDRMTTMIIFYPLPPLPHREGTPWPGP